MILDGTQVLASPLSPVGERRLLRFVSLETEASALRIHLALNRADEASSWEPVLLRTFAGGRVLLAAHLDHGHHVREWLELWIQTNASFASTPTPGSRLLNNGVLDQRWSLQADSFQKTDRAATIVTGFERKHPRPLWLNPETAKLWPIEDIAGETIELCKDEHALNTHGLPGYGGSLARHLWVKNRAELGFLRVDTAVSNASNESTPHWAKGRANLLPINPEAGFLLVRRHAPLDFEAYANFLSGHGLSPGGSIFVFNDPASSRPIDVWDRLQQSGIHLFPTTRGLAGRFMETLHLKLLLFSQMLQAVQAAVAAQNTPWLQLNATSFRVDFADPAGNLPILWTARPALVGVPAALPIPMSGTTRCFFRRVEKPHSSVYAASHQAEPTSGQGTLRIRKVSGADGQVSVHATLATDEYLRIQDSDLVSIDFPLPGIGSFCLYGKLDTSDALSVFERRFQAFPFECSAEKRAALQATEGRAFRGVAFESVPLFGARHDLYSLGVMGARLFFTEPRHSLAEAVDEMLSLARALGDTEGDSVGARACALASSDPRWHVALGAHRHGHGSASANEAYRWVPLELWWDLVSTLSRFFPGAGKFSFAPDFNDPSEQPLTAVFEDPLREMERLVQRSRSLLFSDWLANREVARVIQRIR